MDRHVSIEELTPGMVIKHISRQSGDVKVNKSGLVTSPEMVASLRDMGVEEVLIDTDLTVEISDSPKQSYRQSHTTRLLTNASGSAQPTIKGYDPFLSAQAVPGLAHFYARPVVLAMLLCAGGLGLGWSASQADKLVAHYQSSSFEKVASNPAVTALPAENTSPKADVTPPQPSTEPQSQVSANEDSSQLASPVSEPVVSSEPVVADTSEEDGVIVNQTDTATDTASISPELLKRFQEAIEAVDNAPEADAEGVATTTNNNQPDVPPVHELPAWVLTQLPTMAFTVHMYASDPSERWIKVNGRRVVEGGLIDDELRLVAIQPQHVILAFKGHEFSMSALTDW